MASSHQMTQKKRERERNQVERREVKEEKRTARKEQSKAERQALLDQGIDPDLVGIIPGPQPPSKW